MQHTKLILAAAWLIFTGAAVRAEAPSAAHVATRVAEVTIVSNVLGPEGPLFVDGNLYYVG
jgi:hypothetical protein